MKKHLTLLMILGLGLFLSITHNSQAQTVTVGSVISNAGQDILVPINFTGLDYVGAISLYIFFDDNVMTFNGITNVSPEGSGTLANAIPNPSQVGISWLAPGSTGVDFPDGKFLDLQFTFAGGYTDLTFAPYCEIVDWDINVINAVYINGSVSSPVVSFNLTVFLEGAYQAGSDGTMRTDLYNSGIIPMSQPYGPSLPYYGNANPFWYYPGTENIANLPASTVDWVLVELRDAATAAQATSATRVALKACLLMSNGSIRELNGTSIPTFFASFTQGAFVVVWHRNHLGIMSANPVAGFGGSYAYNFSTDANKVYGGSAGYKVLETNVWGMVSGDINADKNINISDKSNGWTVEAAKNGYKGPDANLNVQVNNLDKNDFIILNSGKISGVPN
jgi:hypothetical protein